MDEKKLLEKLKALQKSSSPMQGKGKPPLKEFDCFKCPYLKDVGKAYFCMFFSLMDCPKGYGVPSIVEYRRTGIMPSEKKKESKPKSGVVVRQPFPDPIPRTTKKESDLTALTTLYHRQIYEMRYLEDKTFREIAEYLGCSTSYINHYIDNTNEYWGWKWDASLCENKEEGE